MRACVCVCVCVCTHVRACGDVHTLVGIEQMALSQSVPRPPSPPFVLLPPSLLTLPYFYANSVYRIHTYTAICTMHIESYHLS